MRHPVDAHQSLPLRLPLVGIDPEVHRRDPEQGIGTFRPQPPRLAHQIDQRLHAILRTGARDRFDGGALHLPLRVLQQLDDRLRQILELHRGNRIARSRAHHGFLVVDALAEQPGLARFADRGQRADRLVADRRRRLLLAGGDLDRIDGTGDLRLADDLDPQRDLVAVLLVRQLVDPLLERLLLLVTLEHLQRSLLHTRVLVLQQLHQLLRGRHTLVATQRLDRLEHQRLFLGLLEVALELLDRIEAGFEIVLCGQSGGAEQRKDQGQQSQHWVSLGVWPQRLPVLRDIGTPPPRQTHVPVDVLREHLDVDPGIAQRGPLEVSSDDEHKRVLEPRFDEPRAAQRAS